MTDAAALRLWILSNKLLEYKVWRRTHHAMCEWQRQKLNTGDLAL